MEIKVLGPGCARCDALAARTAEALAELGLEVPVTKVADVDEMLAYRVLLTPALVVDGEVKCSGRVPRREEIKGWLRKG